MSRSNIANTGKATSPFHSPELQGCADIVTVGTHEALNSPTCPSLAKKSKRTGRTRLTSQRPSLGSWVLFLCVFLLASKFLASDPAAPVAGGYYGADAATAADEQEEQPLLLTDISRLKVRELKRRLALQHGYSAEEIGRMIDKKDLVEALAYEEHRLDVKRAGERRRRGVKHSVMVALAAVALVMFWPLIRHLWEIVSVNFVVYTDKKWYEFGRCRELQSPKGCFGLFLVSIMDALQLWLSVSVALSWVMRRNKYFFPTPNLPVRPAALVSGATGGAAGGGPLGQYGINIGPMIITWALQWLRRKLESWLGGVLADAHRYQRAARREARGGGDDGGKKKKKRTPEEKEARRAARAARRAEREEAAAGEAGAAHETTRDGVPSQADADGASGVGQDAHGQEDQAQSSSPSHPDKSEMRKAAADAAESRRGRSGGLATDNDYVRDAQDATESSPANYTDFDELD